MPQEAINHLTAAEAGVLWSQYVNSTMAICMFNYFLAKSEDREIREVTDFALKVTQTKAQRAREILTGDQYPVPVGFTDEDVDIDGPRLYTDRFALAYVRNIARIDLTTYSLCLSTSFRQDVRSHYQKSISEVEEIDERALQAEKSKGLYTRAPYISAPERAVFVQDTAYLGSIFGHKRPLNALEIANILVGSENSLMGTALLMGFAQTAQSQEMREFFLRGKRIAHKHAEIFSDLLAGSDMPAPISFGSDVTNATVASFSDKLMLYHATLVGKAGLTYYGTALGFTVRTDVIGAYARMMAELTQYLEDASALLIRQKWLEQPPMAEDRRSLVMR